MLVSVPEPMATQQAGLQCLSAPVPVKKSDCDQQMCGLFLDGLAAHPPSTSDFISYPSAIPQDNEVLFGHSADHINFFSAREKFKGMSQDGKSCQLKSCGKEQQPLPQEVFIPEEKEEEKRKVRNSAHLFPLQTHMGDSLQSISAEGLRRRCPYGRFAMQISV